MRGDTGKIRHRDRAAQFIDYSGLKYDRNATPSNLDGFLELSDQLFVLLEYKHSSAQTMSYGQRTLIERVVDALHHNGKYAVAIIGQHETPSSEDIEAAESKAIEVRWEGKWVKLEDKSFTVKNCLDCAYHYAFNEPF